MTVIAYRPREPYAASASVREVRDAYLRENGFTAAAYESAWVEVSLFGMSFRTPNTDRRRWGLRLHDLHHVVTGFGTDLVGEAEISAWELGRGLRGLGPYVGAIIASVALLGLVIAPRRTTRAWRSSRAGNGGHTSQANGSLFQTRRDYESLLQMRVGDLRRELGVPEDGIAVEPRRLHAKAPRAEDVLRLGP